MTENVSADPGTGRLLVAEDEFLVATVLEQDLRAAGYIVVGPFGSLAQATAAARHETFDLALLDVNLKGEMVYPLADELTRRQIPFVLLSGYGAASLPERLRASPRVSKPYDPDMLLREISRVLSFRPAGAILGRS